MASKELLGGELDLLGWSSLPQDWRFDLLGNRCSIRRGSSPRPAGDPIYFGGGSIPWIKIGDATKVASRYIESTEEFVNEQGAKQSVRIPPGSLIIANSGVSLGFAVITRIEGCIHDGWLLLTDFKDLDRDYLYYCVNFVTQKVRNFADGTTQPNLNTDIARRLLLPMPPLPEQRMIARILGTLDDKIELNRRMNQTLEAIARAIFKSWFVDFDPVRAKAEGRDPGLPAPLADLFPGRLVDSELGEIPEGWRVGPILKQAQLLSGGTPKTERKDYWDGGIPWASAKDVSQCSQTFLIGTERTISQKGLEESATQLIPAYCTVVVARGATTGRMVMFGREMAMNQTCYSLASASDTPFTLYCHLRHEMDNLVHTAHGSVFDTITTSTFASSKFVLPSTSVLKALEQTISPMFHRILETTEQIQTLATLRDALLPKLISGVLRVPTAEKSVQAFA